MLCTRIHARNGILLVIPYSRLAPGSYSVSLAVHLFSRIAGSFKDVKSLLMFLIFIFMLLIKSALLGKRNDNFIELNVGQSQQRYCTSLR